MICQGCIALLLDLLLDLVRNQVVVLVGHYVRAALQLWLHDVQPRILVLLGY